MAFSRGPREQNFMCGGPDAQKWRQAKDLQKNEMAAPSKVVAHARTTHSRSGSVVTNSSFRSTNQGIIDMLSKMNTQT